MTRPKKPTKRKPAKPTHDQILVRLKRRLAFTDGACNDVAYWEGMACGLRTAIQVVNGELK